MNIQNVESDLWQLVTSRDSLQEAWHKVLSNEGGAGGDGVGLDQFKANLFANLTDLRAELLAGTYRTGPFRKVSIPKKKPGYRILQCVGLHTGFAFLHGVRDRHEGLIFDLMEPFRAALTEGLVVYLFNARRLRAEMFLESDQRPVEINEEGRRAIILGYETAVARRVNRPDGGGRLGWRAMMEHQARTLATAVQDGPAQLFFPYLMEP